MKGNDAVKRFDFADNQFLIDDASVVGSFIGPGADDPADESVGADIVATSLRQPVSAPTIERSLVPGDRVAIALDSGLWDPSRAVTPLLSYLVEHGVGADQITVVCTPSGDAQNVNQLIDSLPDAFDEINIVTHNPEDRDGLAYLASTRDGQRIYLNRLLVDADVPLVVGRTGFDPLLGMRGTVGDVFPALSDSAARNRAVNLAMEQRQSPTSLRQRQKCEEVGWLSGLFYALGIALDRHRHIDRSWFGHFPAVQDAADQYAVQHWTTHGVPDGADLVVATTSRQATWETVGAAMETASRLASENGRILLLSDLSAPPGPGMRRLMEDENAWNIIARLQSNPEDPPADALATGQCARALASHRVYLYSTVEESVIESMGLVPVNSPREAQRMLEHGQRCFVVQEADRVQVTPR